MNIYLLVKDEDYEPAKEENYYWTYDTNQGFVIRAVSEKAARDIAYKKYGDEPKDAWTNTKKSKITLLAENVSGEAGVILSDFWSV